MPLESLFAMEKEMLFHNNNGVGEYFDWAWFSIMG